MTGDQLPGSPAPLVPPTPPAASVHLEARLGYLLKHAQQRLTRASAEALAPFGVDGHELAVLAVLAAEYPLSQVEVAGRLGVDRTTMVALVDGLEDHGLVERRRSPQDRRKNIVELTAAGHDCLRRAELARRETEQRFLAPLGEEAGAEFVRALRLLVVGVREGEG
ncbi:MarR family winged helix-turn-helix transcriptional regulator [Streptomyces sp. NPDC057950]|uniref:MarR family winged helix-turn-helix transcriptional regulator n=1 Tax=Streptomyces sp. NPDC057950 TaxID=3346288 RepID=UPI0036E589E4